MAKWIPDQSFYPSPRMAMRAPQETLAYVAMLEPSRKRPDSLAVVDVDPASKTYSTVVGQVDMPKTGDELHHFGWNACSSCLCPYSPHPHMERRYLIVPGMIEGKFLRSPYAHARIRAIDTREAEALPGVVAVLTSKDLADVGPYIGRSKNKDQPIIAFERVIYAGQPVAAVAAADRATAEAAAAKIRVDYEELPAVIEIDEAIADGAPTRDLQKPMRFSKTPSNFR